jgi:hypothetical protein
MDDKIGFETLLFGGIENDISYKAWQAVSD